MKPRNSLCEVRKATTGVRPSDRDFLVKQFEDLVVIAKARRYLLEAMANYRLEQQGKKQAGLPDAARFRTDLEEMQKISEAWQARYPGGRYQLTENLREWLKILRH